MWKLILHYEYNFSKIQTSIFLCVKLRHMLEDIEEGELDYDEEDTDMGDGVEDLPDLPEYDPSANDKGERGEIVSDNNVSYITFLCNFTDY